jgi:hypothetical protein
MEMKSVQTMNGAAHESFICKSGAKLVRAGKKCVADKCVQLTGVQPTRVDFIRKCIIKSTLIRPSTNKMNTSLSEDL